MPNASPAESIAYQFDPYLSLLDKRDLGKVLKKSERSTKKKADYSLSPRRGPNSISVEGCGASPFEIRGSRDLVINPVALGWSMGSLNRVLLIGNLTRDPEVRYTPKGTAVADIGVAVNRVYSGDDRERKEETTFVDVTVKR
jgi:single-stranded DNA-binding protein